MENQIQEPVVDQTAEKTEPKKTNEQIVSEYQAKTNLEYQKEMADIKKQELIDIRKDKQYQAISNFLKINGFPDLSMQETKAFVATCQTTGLNPFKREIYAIPFKKVDKTTGEESRSIMPVISYEVAVRKYRNLYPNDKFVINFEGEGQNMIADFRVDRYLGIENGKPVFIEGFWTPGYKVKLTEYAKMRYDYKTKTKELDSVWAAHPEQMLTKCLVQRAIRYLAPDVLEGLYIEDELANVQEPITNETHAKGFVSRLRESNGK